MTVTVEKDKKLTPAQKRAHTLINWIDGIPPEFAGRKEQIKDWLEERYDNPKNKYLLKKPDGGDPWGKRQRSAIALREAIAMGDKIADQWLKHGAGCSSWSSLGWNGRRASPSLNNLPIDQG